MVAQWKRQLHDTGITSKIPGSLFKNAPSDMFSALGKNGQFINVIPSQNMVWIRMGDNPDNALVPFLFNEDVWDYINDLACTTSTSESEETSSIKVYPNPANDYIIIKSPFDMASSTTYFLTDALGKVVGDGFVETDLIKIDISHLINGIYFLKINHNSQSQDYKFIKE